MPSLLERLIGGLLPELRADIDNLKLQQEHVMATQAQFDERMGKIDAATSEIAADLQALRNELKESGAVSDENLAVLDAKIARLVVLGADPENPVPEV